MRKEYSVKRIRTKKRMHKNAHNLVKNGVYSTNKVLKVDTIGSEHVFNDDRISCESIY